MKFWLKLMGAIIMVLITPALKVFSSCYRTFAQEVGEMMSPCSWVTMSISLAVASCLSILYAVYFYKRSKKSFKAYLVPVSGKGYCIDKRYNEPVCPKCAANGAETFLQVIKSRNPDFNDSLSCGVCYFSTELESCWIKDRDNEMMK